MKNLKILLMCSAVILVSACGHNNDSDGAAKAANFNDFTRDVFAKTANSEPEKVELGVTFKVSDNDSSLDFSDLLN